MAFDIEKMRRNRDAGTPGPFHTAFNGSYAGITHDPTKNNPLGGLIAKMHSGRPELPADIERIAMVPEMEAEIERLTAERDEWKEQAEAEAMVSNSYRDERDALAGTLEKVKARATPHRDDTDQERRRQLQHIQAAADRAFAKLEKNHE